jgi:hypothetical protein
MKIVVFLTIPDNLVSLSNFILFRNDRLVSNGGGVCAYINSNVYCRRIEEFENSSIESLWLSVRPKKLPRSVSVILSPVYTTVILGTARLNFGTRTHFFGHGIPNFCRVNAKLRVRGPKILSGPRPPQEVVSARLKMGPRTHL